ncbi:MAG: acyl carrier protein [Planctomycetota bacterium]
MTSPPDLNALKSYILQKFAKRGTVSIEDNTSLVKSGWVDSFAIVDIVAFIESEYGIQLPDGDVVPENFENIAIIRQVLGRSAS